MLVTLFFSLSFALQRAAVFRKERKTLELLLSPHDVSSFESEVAFAIGQSIIPVLGGLYILREKPAVKKVAVNKDAVNEDVFEKKIVANKDLLEKLLVAMERQILSNEELIVSNKELKLEIIKANEKAKIEN